MRIFGREGEDERIYRVQYQLLAFPTFPSSGEAILRPYVRRQQVGREVESQKRYSAVLMFQGRKVELMFL